MTGIQRHLARLGCSPGRPDGKWGLRTSTAITNLNVTSGQKLNSSAPEQDTLDALRGMQGTICKAPTQVVKPTQVKPKPKVVKKTYPTKKKSTTTQKKNYAKPKKKEYWGGESTRIECEEGGQITEKCF